MKHKILFACIVFAAILNGCDEEAQLTNDPPGIPFNPNPPNEATHVTVSSISWDCIDADGDSLTFDIFFGASPSPPLVSSNNTLLQYPTGILNNNTVYYWKIAATDAVGNITNGPVWSFTTDTLPGNVNLPPLFSNTYYPANSATTIPIDTTLTWEATDPDGDPITYDIYFGTSSTPSLIASDMSTTFYSPSTMATSTTYYWQVFAKDDKGNQTSSPLLNFTTSQPGNQPPSSPSNPSPAHSSINNPIMLALNWSASIEPEGEPITYDVYFDTLPNPAFYQSTTNSTIVPPVPLNLNTTYYWKIVAKDVHGNESPSSDWVFNTIGVVCPQYLTDPRDGKTYPVVAIGTQCWTAKNMAYYDITAGLGACYDNDWNNCSYDGMLYDFDAALEVCPPGWHLPSDNEWKQLEMTVGMTQTQADQFGYRGTNQGDILAPGGSSGFNVQYAGAYVNTGGSSWAYDNIFINGYYFSSTPAGTSHVYGRTFQLSDGRIYRSSVFGDSGHFYSCRCVKN